MKIGLNAGTVQGKDMMNWRMIAGKIHAVALTLNRVFVRFVRVKVDGKRSQINER